MKKTILFLLTCLVCYGTQAKVRRVGDLNEDGKLNSKDVEMMVKYVLGLLAKPVDIRAIDINADGKISIADVTALIKNLRNPENLPVIVLPDSEATDDDDAIFD